MSDFERALKAHFENIGPDAHCADFEAGWKAAMKCLEAKAEVTLEVVSAHDEPESFGERALKVTPHIDIQKLPYGTRLTTHPAVPNRMVELHQQLKPIDKYGIASVSTDEAEKWNELWRLADACDPAPAALPPEWEVLPEDLRTHLGDFKSAVAHLAGNVEHDQDGYWTYQFKTIQKIEALLASPPPIESEPVSESVSRDAARWRYISRYLLVDDVGDDERVWALTVNWEALERDFAMVGLSAGLTAGQAVDAGMAAAPEPKSEIECRVQRSQDALNRPLHETVRPAKVASKVPDWLMFFKQMEFCQLAKGEDNRAMLFISEAEYNSVRNALDGPLRDTLLSANKPGAGGGHG